MLFSKINDCFCAKIHIGSNYVFRIFGVKIHIQNLFFCYSFFERSSTVFQSCLSSFVIRLFVKSKTCWDTTSQIIRACVAFLMTPRVSKSCQIKMTSIHELFLVSHHQNQFSHQLFFIKIFNLINLKLNYNLIDLSHATP